MRAFVTGAAGFIGSHLCEHLLERGIEVIGVDNLSKGKLCNIEPCTFNKSFKFFEGDVLDEEFVSKSSEGADFVVHLADDSDIQFALNHPDTYFKNNVIGLYSVLSAMQRNAIRRIIFPSSTTVFGNRAQTPIPVGYGPLLPESLYGASKVSAEAFLHAWTLGFGIDALVFRFAAIIGGRQDHGVVHDFAKRLSIDGSTLQILGNGQQIRSFVLVDDCVRIIVDCLLKTDNRGFSIIHLGNPDTISILEVAKIVCAELGIDTSVICCQHEALGWVGDSPTNELDISYLKELNMLPSHDSKRAVIEAARRLCIQYRHLRT